MIPTFDKFMFPILDWLKDGQVRTNKEVQQKMQEVFHPSEEEIKDKTSKGNIRFYSNVNWALTFFCIRLDLQRNPSKVDMLFHRLIRNISLKELRKLKKKSSLSDLGLIVLVFSFRDYLRNRQMKMILRIYLLLHQKS